MQQLLKITSALEWCKLMIKGMHEPLLQMLLLTLKLTNYTIVCIRNTGITTQYSGVTNGPVAPVPQEQLYGG